MVRLSRVTASLIQHGRLNNGQSRAAQHHHAKFPMSEMAIYQQLRHVWGIMLRMSKAKSPPEKKRLSLQKDRRNVYGECPTSSRKNIRLNKQRGHMEVRRAANEELRALKGVTVEADAEEIESRAKGRILALARSSFKKFPDAPLGKVVQRKLKHRALQAKGRSSR
jgi:hypothetical protein